MWSRPSLFQNFGYRNFATPVTECLDSSTYETWIGDLPKCRPRYPPHLYHIFQFQESPKQISRPSIPRNDKILNSNTFPSAGPQRNFPPFQNFGLRDLTNLVARLSVLQLAKPWNEITWMIQRPLLAQILRLFFFWALHFRKNLP